MDWNGSSLCLLESYWVKYLVLILTLQKGKVHLKTEQHQFVLTILGKVYLWQLSATMSIADFQYPTLMVKCPLDVREQAL